MTLYADRKRDTDVKNKLLDSEGEGEGEVIWENTTETCILSYVKEMTSPSSMHETGHSKPVFWDNPEGGGHVYTHGWFMSVYGENQYNNVK